MRLERLSAALATTLVLLAGAPVAGALNQTEWVEPPPMRPSADVGCLDVVGAARFPPGCEASDGVQVSWSATEDGAEGWVAFRVRPGTGNLFDLHLLSLDVDVLEDPPALPARVLQFLEGAPAPASVEVLAPAGPPSDARIAIEVRFRVEWAGGCAWAHGTATALVDGAQADARIEPSFSDLCGVLSGARSGADPAAALALARILVESAGALPGVSVDPVLAALDAFPALPEPTVFAEGGADAEADPAAGRAEADAWVEPRAALEEAQPDAPPGATRVAPAPVKDTRAPAAPPGRATAPLLPEEPAARAQSEAAPPADSVPPARLQPEPARVRAHGAAPAIPATAPAAALAAGAGAALLLATALALYQRHSLHASLSHPARAALHEALAKRAGGGSVAQLAQEAGLARKTAEYHLLYLARLGVVRVSKPGDGPRVFHLHAREEALSLAEALVRRIRESPGVSTQDLARVLGVSRARVDWRVKGLVLDGLVRSARVDGERRLFPA